MSPIFPATRKKWRKIRNVTDFVTAVCYTSPCRIVKWQEKGETEAPRAIPVQLPQFRFRNKEDIVDAENEKNVGHSADV